MESYGYAMSKLEPIKPINDLEFLVDEVIKLVGSINIIRDDLADVKRHTDHLRYEAVPEITNKLDEILNLLKK